jgi:hypothetical protein
MDDNLARLDRLFRKARTHKESLFYSKLAILELCGWIEESMDDVVLRCAVRCLKVSGNRAYVETAIVKRNYGFEYERHFRGMLGRVVGLAHVERIERRVDPSIHARFIGTLSTLSTVRNAEAHTHLKGVTRAINAPSVTRAQFADVYAGLVEYDRVLRKYIG